MPSDLLRHICAACVPAGIPFLTYNWRAEIWNLFFVLGIALGGFIGYQVLGHPEWLEDERFNSGDARSKNRHALNALIDAATRTNTTAHWVETLNQAGVPCGPINDMQQVFEDVQVKHLAIAQALGGVAYLGQPFTLSRDRKSVV